MKASHILVSGDGRVKLSGNRNVISMVNSEQQIHNVHDFPKHDTQLLPWLSPEILQQVMFWFIQLVCSSYRVKRIQEH